MIESQSEYLFGKRHILIVSVEAASAVAGGGKNHFPLLDFFSISCPDGRWKKLGYS
jgi:hypothetical protein